MVIKHTHLGQKMSLMVGSQHIEVISRVGHLVLEGVMDRICSMRSSVEREREIGIERDSGKKCMFPIRDQYSIQY